MKQISALFAVMFAATAHASDFLPSIDSNNALQLWTSSTSESGSMTVSNPRTGQAAAVAQTMDVDRYGFEYDHGQGFDSDHIWIIKGQQSQARGGGIASGNSGSGTFVQAEFGGVHDFNLDYMKSHPGTGIAVFETNSLTWGIKAGYGTAKRTSLGASFSGSGTGIGYDLMYRRGGYELFSGKEAWKISSVAAPYEIGLGYVFPVWGFYDGIEVQAAAIIPDARIGSGMSVGSGYRVGIEGQKGKIVFAGGYVDGLKFKDAQGSYTAFGVLGIPAIPADPIHPWTSYQAGLYAQAGYNISRGNTVSLGLQMQNVNGSGTALGYPTGNSDRATTVTLGYTHSFY